MKPREGYVYLIQCKDTGWVKIGYSVDPKRRLRALQTGSPSELVLLGMYLSTPRIERGLHAACSDWHRIGEWFAPDVIEFVGDYFGTRREVA